MLLHVGQEDGAVHGTINHQRRGQSAGSQAGHESGRSPVAMRHLSHEPLATPSAAEAAGHLGVGTCFIKKHQSSIIERRSPEQPGGAAIGDVRPLLLSRMQDFF